ncbi:segregation/condensation protein A [Candidatus Nomurabacteria bacterium]|nr:segregation/condensation protein A [Candidatus Nomurabacteria bacterium]
MTTTTAFAIKTETFEGPMELLIELVEKRKLLINDISLASVTDEYMQTVSAMQELSLPNTAQFITLAATLLLIKSKSLLPVLDLTSEEEASIDDLEQRLKLYQLYRDASLELQLYFGKTNMYEPEYVPPREPLFVPDVYCNVSSLNVAMQEVLAGLPKNEPKPTAKVRPTVSLEDMMERLQRRIEQQMRTKFSEIRAGETEHKNVIVGFLAILELFKQGNILITQEGRFNDIHMELERADTPRYY